MGTLDVESRGPSKLLRRHETKVYLSARFDRQEELREYAEILLQKGVEVISRWLWMPAAYLASWEFKHICAQMDLEDVQNSDIVVSFTGDPDKTSMGGRHVEFGIGLVLNKRMIIIGECENVFHFMKDVEVYPSFDIFIIKTLGGD